jgi:hypothetical protein
MQYMWRSPFQERPMSHLFRLALVCVAVMITGCASEPTAPTGTPSLTAPGGANHDDSIDPNPDGTCRSGYSVTNGRCVPIS